MSTDTNHKVEHGYDFNATMQNGYHQTHSSGYDDMVFPERKLY